jgi:hypothetical protein
MHIKFLTTALKCTFKGLETFKVEAVAALVSPYCDQRLTPRADFFHSYSSFRQVWWKKRNLKFSFRFARLGDNLQQSFSNSIIVIIPLLKNFLEFSFKNVPEFFWSKYSFYWKLSLCNGNFNKWVKKLSHPYYPIFTPLLTEVKLLVGVVQIRVARFSLVQCTKIGKNTPNVNKI